MKNLFTKLWDILVTFSVMALEALTLILLCAVCCIYWIAIITLIAPIMAICDADDVRDIACSYLEVLSDVWNGIIEGYQEL